MTDIVERLRAENEELLDANGHISLDAARLRVALRSISQLLSYGDNRAEARAIADGALTGREADPKTCPHGIAGWRFCSTCNPD